MKKLLCTLPCLLLLCSCGTARETNMLSPVSAIAIATTPNGIFLTVETAWQSSTEGSAEPQYLTGRAATIPEAFTAAAAGVGSDLYFSHAQVLVVDAQTAQNGMSALCDYLCSESEMRLGLRLAVARDVSAEQVLKSWAPGGDIPGMALERILVKGKDRHNTIDMPFFRFYNDLLSGAQAALPAVTLGPDKQVLPDGTAYFTNGHLAGFSEGGNANV